MKCEKCGTEMQLSDGWILSSSHSGTSGVVQPAEPFCPKCDFIDHIDFVDHPDHTAIGNTESQKEYIVFNRTESLAESVLTDLFTFSLLIFCIWISSGSTFWTIVSGTWFLKFCWNVMTSETLNRRKVFKTKRELQTWVDSLEDDLRCVPFCPWCEETLEIKEGEALNKCPHCGHSFDFKVSVGARDTEAQVIDLDRALG